MNIEHLAILELDKLKTVCRNSIISDGTREENAAEHSWHMAMALMTLKNYLPAGFDRDRAIRMALAHDICEIGAGDVPVYSNARGQETESEALYIDSFKAEYGVFGAEIYNLWHEYESQKTLESRWVKLVDRIMPFILNYATEGRIWRERGIKKSQVLNLNTPVREVCPAIYEWMTKMIDEAVANGWLKDA